jgi:hypothetical protein
MMIKRQLIVHPILLALFPVLFLYSRNAGQFPLEVIVLPALALVGGTIVIWVCAALALRSAHKGATLASLTVLLVFSYGMCISSLRTIWGDNTWVGPGCALAVALLAILVAATLLIRKAPEHIERFLKIENFAAACLVIVPVISITSVQLRRADIIGPKRVFRVSRPDPVSAAYPDVYYIILDGYARADTLKDIYGYDNSQFLSYLTSKGFVVASKSRPNYGQTGLSLASSLNMDYLDSYTASFKPQGDDRTALSDLIYYSAARRFFADHGYSFTVFASNYYLLDLQGADCYIRPTSLNEFQGGVVNMTPLSATDLAFDAHRKRVRYAFEHLADPAKGDTRAFVLAHISAPHPPFVFDAEGNDVTPREEYSMMDGSALVKPDGQTCKQYREGYIAQLAYINKLVEQAVDSILKNAKVPPVIIVQGDHGPGSLLDQESPENSYLNERFGILNAYYFPGGTPPELYDSISPVNTFRVVLNHCFGTSFKMLPDDSYFATWSQPYKYIAINKAIETETREKAAVLLSAKGTAGPERQALTVPLMQYQGTRP